MCPALRVKDVISERLDGFDKGLVILNCNLNYRFVDLAFDIKNIISYDVFANIEVFDIRLNAAFKIKSIAITCSLIYDRSTDAFCQVSLMAEIIEHPFVV